MVISCTTCSLNPKSCICLECFLNGNHEGHNYIVYPHSTENCDCGDISQWKQSGFCSKHHGLEDNSHPENYLDEKLRILLTDIVFKASFTAIKNLPGSDLPTLTTIIQFLQSFLKFGDGFRRLLTISLTEKIDPLDFFDSILSKDLDFNLKMVNFVGFNVKN